MKPEELILFKGFGLEHITILSSIILNQIKMYIIEIIVGVICAILFIIGFIYSMFRFKCEFIIIEKKIINPRHKILSRKDILEIIAKTNDDNIKVKLKLALRYRKYQNRFYLSMFIVIILFGILHRYVGG